MHWVMRAVMAVMMHLGRRGAPHDYAAFNAVIARVGVAVDALRLRQWRKCHQQGGKTKYSK